MEERKRKTLQELEFKDSFMFAAVMMDKDNARGVIERAIGIEIDHLEVVYEKSIIYNPEYKGVRLDVYARDEENTRFNVEMQVVTQNILKRSRYYHSQIDMDLLETGLDYDELPKSYVIFICDFDPIGLKKYKYTRVQRLKENQDYEYDDGSYTIFLSTVGENEDEVSEDLVQFLKYVRAGNKEEKNDDSFVRQLQKSVEKIKLDREMGGRYMLFELICRDEFRAGKAEGKAEFIISLLEDIAPVSAHLKEEILSIQSEEKLARLFKKAAKAESLEEFEKELGLINQ